MKELVAVGACASDPAARLLTLARDRGFTVTQITPDGHAGEAPSRVDQVALNIDATCLVDWWRRRAPSGARSAAWIALDMDSAHPTAVAAAHLGMPGPDPLGVLHGRSKRAWRAALRDHHVATPRSVFVKEAEFARAGQLSAALRPPLVLKADCSALPMPVRLCAGPDALPEQLVHLWNETGLSPAVADGVLVDEYLDGPVYSVCLFDGACVGVLHHVRPAAHDFFERGITTDIDLPDAPLLQLVDTARRVAAALDLRWGPVTLDCILHHGVPHVVDIDAGLYGTFTCQLLRDAYGFDQIAALLDKLQGDGPALAAGVARPRCYARVDFLLDGDPMQWDIPQRGEVETDEVFLRYGPQPLHERDRRAYVYFRSKVAPASASQADAQRGARPLWWLA